MNLNAINRIVILGGGMTGWTVAAALAKGLQGIQKSILLIDSAPQAVSDLQCEATTPACVAFHQFLGISETDLLSKTGSSFLLATQFNDWSDNQQNYFLPFNDHGFMLNRIEFPQYAISRYLSGAPLNFDDFSLASAAAKAGRFLHPSKQESSLFSTFNYGLNLNVTAYTDYLRDFAVCSGVEHICADVSSFSLDAVGNIESITLADYTQFEQAASAITNGVVSGDLFIDCSGVQAALIEKALNIEWHSAEKSLPVTHVLSHVGPVAHTQAVPSHRILKTVASGWMQQISTQTQTEQQYFYHRNFVNAAQACAELGVDPANVTIQQLSVGRRQLFWAKNCVAIGDSAGNIGVQGAGKLHLIQSAVLRLISLFPQQLSSVFNAAEYNRLTHLEYDHIEDFHVLHNQLASTQSSVYWQQVARTKLSDRLLHKLELFKLRGLIAFYEGETFSPGVWTSLLLGNGFWPQNYDPLIRNMDSGWIEQQLGKMKNMIHSAAESMPLQADYLNQKKYSFFQSTRIAAIAN
ncbi:MAG: tryptophan 7-halogenase [Cellvibrio sp.]|uniref:tryptophan 7-halogenase n=1 Tax=Cellvibrio sp. TaxID=1965322 RepID=UPI0031B3AB28